MYMTGNKTAVHRLLRGCREAFRSANNDGFAELLKIYEILFDMCRPARMLDEEGTRILGDHQDEWLRLVGDVERLRNAVDNLFDALRDGLEGTVRKDADDILSEFRTLIVAEKSVIFGLRLRVPTAAELKRSISEENYCGILRVIKNTATAWEQTPNSYRHMGEEDLRNVLLGSLNGVFPGMASGETFRKDGKTDICIEAEDQTAFVAECKMWTGESEVPKALAQLDSYLTWKDYKTALIYFVDRKDFLAITDKMLAILQDQKDLQGVRSLDRNEFVCRMSSTRTPGHAINVRVFLFNLHSDEDKKGASK